MRTEKQTPTTESQEERCRRILAGVPKVRPASELRFDYEKATQQATQGVRTSEPVNRQANDPGSLGGG